jgi:hypothetical protein
MKFERMVDKIATTKPVIDNITNLFPLQLPSTLLVIPMA